MGNDEKSEVNLLEDKKLYWLWLQKSLGFGAKIRDLISYYGDAKNFYEAGEASWRSSGFFGPDHFEISPSKIEKCKRTLLKDGEIILRQCEENGIEVITPDSPYYPFNLKLIADYPAVLFVRGDLSCLNESLSVAVIGTRHPSQYGITSAEILSRDLAKKGALIVSGGALGIDSIAHKSALFEGAKTVLVLGCGHLAKYLSENEPLRIEVSEHGAVISEYPPMTQSYPSLFPMRNRIISGLSKGVLIVEAGEKSGTLNTARHAKEQGRDIFAVPGDITSMAYAGSNKLIREGAKAVFSANDIIDYYIFSLEAIKEIETAEKTEPSNPFDGIDRFPYGEPKKKKTKAKSKAKITEKKKEKANTEEKPGLEKAEKIIEKEEKTTEEKIFSNFIAESVSEDANLVYNYMSGEENTLDEIARDCALTARKVLIALTELEMKGVIVSCGAGRYKKAL